MNVVRNETPGTRARIRASSVSYPLPVPGRFIRRNTSSDACCSGRSMYLTTLSHSGHRVEDVVGDGRRIEIEQPDPVDAVNRVQLAQQRRQRRALAQIAPVERRVLRDQDQLAHAARRERPRLAHDRVDRAAAVVPAQRRDDAERALVVAALGDLDVREMPRRGEDARRLGVVQIRGEALALGFGLGAVGLDERQRNRADSRALLRSRPTISGTSPVPSTASISGICVFSSSR